jgi:hypothetical protein
MLPNFACIWPIVELHFKILSPTIPARANIHIPMAIFLCFLIRWIFTKANPMIPPIYSVLESVMMIAAIRMVMIIVFSIACLFAVKNNLSETNFCLKNTIITGKNAIKKYP